ncbi:MAG: phosphoribosylaminoimidazolesuccinocarboxamide synthase [Bacteriovoracaceae bacterium]
MTYQLIYQGSVKNLYKSQENILFEFSDRYSLFDWGEMPDHLEQKGEALALMGALFFKEVEKISIPHHFLSLADSSGKDLSWQACRHLKVKSINVHRPPIREGRYDYSFYQTRPVETLVPLEVIFRFGAGKGSSLVSRVQEQATLLSQWGLTHLETDKLWDLPLIDFSTKLERIDRYLTHTEAKKIAGLSQTEFELLIDQTTKVAFMLKSIFRELGLELWDGKLEWSFLPGEERKFMLVDSIGLDELRVQKKESSLSKEFLREFYRQTSWYQAVTNAKKKALGTDQDFKELCELTPPALSSKELERARQLYLGFTNDLSRALLGKTFFDESYSLKTWGQN